MKKFIITKTGEEVTYGDVVTLTSFEEIPDIGTVKIEETFLLTKKTLQECIEVGTIKVIDTEEPKKKTSEENYDAIWNTALDHIIEKTGWNEKKLANILGALYEVNPWATTQFILMEIAHILDTQYTDHINNSEHIFAVSPQDGRIHELNKATIRSYKAFPAFRSVEDAKIAYSLIKDSLKSIFKDAK